MTIRFNVKGFIDRRSEDLHARYESIEQRRFAHRVARNRKERVRIEHAVAATGVLKRQAC